MIEPFRDGGPQDPPLYNLDEVTPSVLLADVSEFQPDVVDPVYLAWSKAIVIRALYGTMHDDGSWYDGTRRSALHSGGVKFLGIYQYLVSGQSGVAAAQAFFNLVGPIQKGEVFIADFEEGAKSALSDWYNEMLKLYGAEIAPYLWTYSGLSFGDSEELAPWQWLADYASTEPAQQHTLWQFTDSYTIPGVGVADCSLYHGTITELAALAYDTAAVPKAFPPPANLKPWSVNLYVTWTPVTSVKVSSYTVQTLNHGVVFNTQVVKGANATIDGLTPGSTYTIRVWSNGGPIAPSASTFTITV
jgi:hypothetical protein